jgi:hypothetical protein
VGDERDRSAPARNRQFSILGEKVTETQ